MYPTVKSTHFDEMGAGLNLIPSYGRAPSTERVYDTKPTAKGKRTSTIGAMNCTGIVAALTMEGTLNGLAFLYFIEHFLCPLLREGDHVVIDNATAHKVNDVKIMGNGLKQLKDLLEPFNIKRFYTDDWGAYERHLDPSLHVVGKRNTQKIERKNLNLRTWIKRLTRRTICFSTLEIMHDIMIGLLINKVEFGRNIYD